MKRSHELNMTQGAILPKLLQFALPIMAMSILQNLFNTADVVIVGKFASGEAMAAVGSPAYLLGFLVTLFCGICNGTNILCARYYGRHDLKQLSECLHTSVMLALVLSLPLTVLGIVLSPYIPRFLNVDDRLQEMTTVYLTLYFLGLPSDLVNNFAAAGVRATGNSTLPTVYTSIGGLANMLLNCLFVIGLGMDVDGVAIATVLSKYLSTFLLLRFMLRTDDACRLELKQLRFYKGHLLPILQLGVPSAVSSCLPSFTTMTMQNTINTFGYCATAGAAATSSLLNFAYAAFGALTASVSCFTSQNVGAGKHRRVPQVIKRSIALSLLISLTFSCLFYFLGETLLSFFIARTDPSRDEIIAQGMINLFYVGVPIYFYGLYAALSGILGGFGRSFLSMVISFVGIFAFRMLWIMVFFPRLPDPQLRYLYLCLPVGMLFTALMTGCAIVVVYRKYNARMKLRSAAQFSNLPTL